MKRFLTTKQEKEEQLCDYFKSFSQKYDASKAQFGPKNVFDKEVENLEEYTDPKSVLAKARIEKTTFDSVSSFIKLRKSDQNQVWFITTDHCD
jgi:hypothetical protein